MSGSPSSSTRAGRPRFGSLRLSLLLLGLWVAIELVASSRWQQIGTIRQRLAGREEQAQDPQRPTLRRLLSALPVSQRRIWFAPYTTFPETGALESRNHEGVYDTFRAFPSDGLRSNYGAFKLSPADSLFAQASSQGLISEARLAQALGYRWFALDRGALNDHERIDRLCRATAGCRRSGDGYALFRLDATAAGWMGGLSGVERRLPLLPQTSTAPRWGGLVFDPMQWWPPTPATVRGAEGSFRVWALPLWQMELHRQETRGLPPLVQRLLAPAEQRVQVVLAPGLAGVELCIGRSEVMARTPERCRVLELNRARPRAVISDWLERGANSTIAVRWIFDAQGLPLPARLLPAVADNEGRPTAFAIEIRPGIGDQLPLPPLPPSP